MSHRRTPPAWRRGLRLAAVLTASAAATVFAGCSTTVGGHGAAATSRPEVTVLGGSFTVIAEPGGGLGQLYTLMGSATKTLDMAMYELVDRQAEAVLAADAARGVSVRVMLDRNREAAANAAAFAYLAARGVQVAWAPPGFAATHEKVFVVDNQTAAVMTLNLTSRYYPNTRDFAVLDADPADVAAIEAVFSADFAGSPVGPGGGDHLVWSPGSTARLVELISSARSSVAVENEELSASGIIDALAADARRGVDVTVTMTAAASWSPAFNELTAAGAHVGTYQGETPLYIHAKVVVVDAGTAEARAFVGSENFTLASLEANRELGLILDTPAAVSSLHVVVTGDFAGANPWQP